MAHERTLNEIQNAIRAHGMWKLRLKTAIATGASKITPDVAGCDKSCDFGKWLHDETMPAKILSSKPYIVIRRLHTEFHGTAEMILKKAVAGEASTAQALLDGKFSEQSDKLVRALTMWKAELQHS